MTTILKEDKTQVFDHCFFETINSQEKAYFLGRIASFGKVFEDGFKLTIPGQEYKILDNLKNLINPSISLSKEGQDYSLKLKSKRMSQDICKHLEADPKDFVNTYRLLGNQELCWDFVRGLFDGHGYINLPDDNNTYPECFIEGNLNVIEDIKSFIEIPSIITDKKLTLEHNSALDFLDILYGNNKIKSSYKEHVYKIWCYYVPSINDMTSNSNSFKWTKNKDNAVAPFKARASDSGYDLVILEKVKTYGDVELWDTGIRVYPKYGWYFDLVPRSSIIKTGYMLANSVGIIDRTYTGNIMIPLIKIDKTAKELVGGERLVQIIPRPIIHAQLEEVKDLEQTERSDKGFGSSGK